MEDKCSNCNKEIKYAKQSYVMVKYSLIDSKGGNIDGYRNRLCLDCAEEAGVTLPGWLSEQLPS